MRISSDHLRRIYGHATQIYPHECFGFLVGVHDQGGCVARVVPGVNVHVNRPDRFEMDAAEFLAVEAVAERDGLEVVGFYHSHPDWPPVPSTEDLRLAWGGSYYLIVAVHGAHPTSAAAWCLSADEPRRFVQVPIEVLADGEDDQVGTPTGSDSR